MVLPKIRERESISLDMVNQVLTTKKQKKCALEGRRKDGSNTLNVAYCTLAMSIA
jgi:hypothetical protein